MKKKIKNIIKHIATYTILAILGGLLFFTNLFANVNAQEQKENLAINNLSNIETHLNGEIEETYQYFKISQNGIYTLLDTNYGQVGQAQDIWEIHFVYVGDNTTTLNNQLILKANNINVTIEFYNLNTLVYTIEQAQGVYANNLYYYAIQSEFTYNEIIITGDTNFVTNAPSFAIINVDNGQIYSNGFQDGYNSRDNEIQTLNNNYNTLQQQYRQLQSQYNALATNEYTFENLFWSVGSVPMAFLMQSFNVNVLGINIRAIITGLVTAIIVIWIIKKILR